MTSPNTLFEDLKKASAALGDAAPQFALVLGTGLGSLDSALESRKSISCEGIPGFPKCFEKHHLLLGKLGGKSVIVLEAPPSPSQGIPWIELGFPIWFFTRMGARFLIISTAGESLDPKLHPGSLLFAQDHLNFMGANPLLGVADERVGPLFLDLNQVYSREATSHALKIARKQKIPARSGTIAATLGPALETPAEKKFFRQAGADALVQSLVPEAIVGAHAGLATLGIVAITDQAIPNGKKPVSIEDMLAGAEQVAPRLEKLILGFLESWEYGAEG